MSEKPKYEELEQRIRELEKVESDLKRAKEALQESEKLLSQLQQIAHVGTWRLDLISDSLTWSDEVYKIFGLSPQEFAVTYEAFLEVVHPDDRSAVDSAYSGSIKDGRHSYEIEHRIVRKDTGEIRHVLERCIHERDTNGSIIRSTGMVQDITERKKAEAEIRKSANFTVSLLQAIPTPVFYKDKEGKYIGCNRAFTEVMGVTTDEIKGKALHELWPSEHAEVYHLKDLELIQTPKHQVYEFEVRDKDGNIRPVIYAKDVFYDENGEVAGLLGAFLDITEIKLAEEALCSSHNRFLTVLNSIDATIYVSDLETYEILFMNRDMIDSFGRDMTGEKCWAVFRGLPGPCPDCTNKQLIDENGNPTGVCVWQGENPITGKYYINYDRAIEWTDGRLVRLQIATDITNLKRMEQQLQQTQKYEAIGTLAGGVAHDFNNLLMGIQGRTSLMAVNLDPSHSHFEHIKAIEDYVQSATSLTKQLLGFSRGGKYEVKPIDINELVDKSAEMFGRTKKEIRIHTKLQSPPPVVAADRTQIEQVLLNLYVNAWQAMLDGGELYIETQVTTLDSIDCEPHKAKPGNYAKLSVTDTGIGMDNATRQQIFDPFFTTKEKSRGTGLGLASAYGIIKNHDGFITVYSEISHGTTFNIYLPLSDNKAYRSASATDELAKGSGTILLVDDEKIVIDVGKEMLKVLGYHVITADCGEQAINELKQKDSKIDMVILDLIMPGMDGGKVFDRIKEILPTLPVLLSSGYALNGQADEIMKRGCSGFIQKPFNISKLSQKLRDILDK